MDTVEILLTDIHTKLDTLQPAIPRTFGRKARNEVPAPPRISWVEPGGDFDFDDPQKAGIDGNLATLVVGLEVQIWCLTLEQCRAVLLNLMRATRAVAGGRSNVEWRDYTNENEGEAAYAKLGWQITARVNMKLPIPAEASPWAEVEATEHSTSLALLWGSFSWGDGHTWGGEVVC